jgi:glycosyltransferase involved in cell wall biosynthesis
MKVLIVTAMWPAEDNPARGAFVRTQAESLEKAGVQTRVMVLSGRNRKLSYIRGMFRVRTLVRMDDIDLIHAHYSYAGLVARTQWKVPVVVTFHGDDVLGTVGSNGRLRWTSSVNLALSRLLARAVDAVIVVNLQMARRLGRVPSNLIPCESDLSLFHPEDKCAARQKLGLKVDRKYLLFAADPAIPVKRFSLASAVAATLAAEDPQVELLVVCRETQERLATYMNACDVLLFTSFQEGSPTIVKQAMSCNMPIVSTDVGDVRELIGGTDGCRICEPTVDAFVAALRPLLQTGSRTNGRAAMAHLDGPIIAQKLVSLYTALLTPGMDS